MYIVLIITLVSFHVISNLLVINEVEHISTFQMFSCNLDTLFREVPVMFLLIFLLGCSIFLTDL